MLWLSDIKELKSTVNDYENHKNLMKKYRETKVLYIDDFFKTGKEKDGISLPTATDIQIAYDILNYRYINENLITIISSERSIDDIFNIDEAIGGRILNVPILENIP